MLYRSIPLKERLFSFSILFFMTRGEIKFDKFPSFYPEDGQVKKNNLTKIIVGVIVIIFFGGINILLVTKIWDPLWNPFRPKPEKVIEKMIEKNQEIKTFTSEVKIDVWTKEEMKEDFNFSLSLLANIDDTNKEKRHSETQFNLKVDFEGMQFSFSGKSKTINEEWYLKLTKVPIMLQPFLTLFGLEIEEIKDRWIKIDLEDIKEKEFKESIEELRRLLELREGKTEEGINKLILKLLKEKKMFKLFQIMELPDTKINKTKVYHYQITLNNKEIKKIIPETIKIFDIKEDPKKFEEKMNKFFEKIGKLSAQLWISKKDYYLHRFKMEKEIDSSLLISEEELRVLQDIKKEPFIVNLKIEMNSYNFNKPVKIEALKEYFEILD